MFSLQIQKGDGAKGGRKKKPGVIDPIEKLFLMPPLQDFNTFYGVKGVSL